MNTLAPTWSMLTLGELTARTRPICYGVLKPGPYDPSGVPLLRIQDMAGNTVDTTAVHYISPALDREFTRSKLEGGEVLLSIQGTVGRVAICPPALRGANISRTLAVIRPDERLSPHFLRYYLLAVAARSGFDTSGTTRASLNISTIRALQVPVPTVGAQQAVVEALDHHLSRLDAAEHLLASNVRRASSLAASFLARLVGPRCEEAGQPIPRAGWSWATLAELSTAASYGTSTKCSYDGLGPTVLRIPNVIGGRVDLTDLKRATDPVLDLAAYQLEVGDLLFVRTNGSPDLIGRSGVVDRPVAAAFASYLIRFRVREELVSPAWVSLVTSAPSWRRRLESLAASSAGQYNLNLTSLGSLPIPLPPRDEQSRLISEAEDHETLRRRLVGALSVARGRAVTLKRSLLAAAFSGNLEAQQPRDEPAAALLARMTSARESAPVVSRSSIKRKN